MAKCTAPKRGHDSIDALSNCPACSKGPASGAKATYAMPPTSGSRTDIREQALMEEDDDERFATLLALARESDDESDWMHALSYGNEHDVAMALAQRPTLTANMERRLAMSPDPEVLLALVGRPRLEDWGVLTSMIGNGHTAVEHAAVTRTDVPEDVRREMVVEVTAKRSIGSASFMLQAGTMTADEAEYMWDFYEGGNFQRIAANAMLVDGGRHLTDSHLAKVAQGRWMVATAHERAQREIFVRSLAQYGVDRENDAAVDALMDGWVYGGPLNVDRERAELILMLHPNP